MNISNWPLGQLMQLPDHCFGRRYMVYCTSRPSGQATGFDIAEIAFPEVCVIWELLIDCTVSADKRFIFRITLGDQLPTTEAMVLANEPLIMGLGEQGPEPREIHLKGGRVVRWNKLRFPIRTSGRRLVCQFENTDTLSAIGAVSVVCSSVPREIPDCLISV